MKFKLIKDTSGAQLLELGPSTGMWSDAVLRQFLGQTARGWPAKFAKVEGVYFHFGEAVTHFVGFEALPNLRRLWGVSGALTSLDGLEHCKQLARISLPDSDKMKVTSLAPLRGLDALVQLRAEGLRQLDDVDAIATLPNLREANLGNPGTPALAPIAHSKNLEWLSLRKWPVEEVGALAELRKLRFLDLGWCPRLADVSALAKLPRLEKVRLYGYGEEWLARLVGVDALRGKICGEDGVEDFDDPDW
ncbi:MAG TPA: hypothetical protein VFQ53_16880 [Kofleriaceae bacterium]|nr:hypothetical protein [Kofleriaceae bacterium]